jgi:hypothetical protein
MICPSGKSAAEITPSWTSPYQCATAIKMAYAISRREQVPKGVVLAAAIQILDVCKTVFMEQLRHQVFAEATKLGNPL